MAASGTTGLDPSSSTGSRSVSVGGAGRPAVRRSGGGRLGRRGRLRSRLGCRLGGRLRRGAPVPDLRRGGVRAPARRAPVARPAPRPRGPGMTRTIPTASSSGSLSWARLARYTSRHRSAEPSSRSAIDDKVSPSAYGHRASALRLGPRRVLRDDQPPADLQPVGPAGEDVRVGLRDPPPVAALAVVTLGQAPQVVARLDHVHPPVRGAGRLGRGRRRRSWGGRRSGSGSTGWASAVGASGAGATGATGAATMATTDSSRPAATRWGPASPGRLTRIRCRDSRATSSLDDREHEDQPGEPAHERDQPEQDAAVVGSEQGLADDSQVIAVGSGLPPSAARATGTPTRPASSRASAPSPRRTRAPLAGHDASGKKIVSIAATRKIRLKINAGRVM